MLVTCRNANCQGTQTPELLQSLQWQPGSAEVPNGNAVGKGGEAKPPAASKDEKPEDQSGVIIWKYPFQGNMLRLETPENMTKEVWEKLNKYIQVLKP